MCGGPLFTIYLKYYLKNYPILKLNLQVDKVQIQSYFALKCYSLIVAVHRDEQVKSWLVCAVFFQAGNSSEMSALRFMMDNAGMLGHVDAPRLPDVCRFECETPFQKNTVTYHCKGALHLPRSAAPGKHTQTQTQLLCMR